MMSLGKPQTHAKFEVATAAVAEILKGKPQISGSSPSSEPDPLIFPVEFDGLLVVPGKPPLHAKFEVAGFIYYGNI